MTQAILDLIKLAKLKGPERKYLDWLRTQPSALSGRLSWDDVEACEPAHFRTAANSGIGCKPEFWAIPLTHEQHARQHRIGQFNFMERDWWLEQVEKSLTRYITS